MKNIIILIFFLLTQIMLISTITIYTEISGLSQFYDENDQLTGSAVEIVEEIQRLINDDTKIEVMPWVRGYNALLNNPNVILFSTTRTKEREELGLKWVGPILRVKWAFYSRADSDLEINSLDDAKKVNAIGTYRDDVREQFLLSQGFTNLDSTNDNVLNIRKLMFYRIDLIIGTNLGILSSLNEAGYTYKDVKLQFVIQEADLYIAFSKETEDHIVIEWDNAFRYLHETGKFEEIYNEYYPGEEVPERIPFINNKE